MLNNLVDDETLAGNDLMEAFQDVDYSPMIKVDPDNCFMVKIWLWDEESQDFSSEKMDKPGHQLFEDYAEAYSVFNALRKKDLPGLLGSEIKLDLIHYKFSRGCVIYSNILLPGTRH